MKLIEKNRKKFGFIHGQVTAPLVAKYRNGNYDVYFFEDGTKVRETNEDDFVPEFSESTDCKLTDKCSQNCSFCYENCSKNGAHGNTTYSFLKHLHPYTEMALNGNDLNHPELLDFLKSLKKQKVFANITVNQNQFMKNHDLIKRMVEDRMIWGLGVSLVSPTKEFIEKVRPFGNAVIHTINGLLTKADIEKLSNNGLKILILGYKIKGRGDSYYNEHRKEIDNNIKYLNENLDDVVKKFKVVSFDNLAIEQIKNIRSVVGNNWEEFYMGDDGKFTFYIDLVKGTFAKNSCTNQRFEIGDKSIDEMFNFIRKENK